MFILFLSDSLIFYGAVGMLITISLLKVPFRQVKSGWIPLGLFLFFTFISNVLFQHGKVLATFGSLVITEEGLHVAAIRTLRVFFMVAGVKILLAHTATEDIIQALSRLMSPLEKVGLPVRDFFHTMGLTLKCFPMLKTMAAEEYAKRKEEGGTLNFMKKVNIISSFILPLFVRSIQSPEIFFQEKQDNGKKP